MQAPSVRHFSKRCAASLCGVSLFTPFLICDLRSPFAVGVINSSFSFHCSVFIFLSISTGFSLVRGHCFSRRPFLLLPCHPCLGSLFSQCCCPVVYSPTWQRCFSSTHLAGKFRVVRICGAKRELGFPFCNQRKQNAREAAPLSSVFQSRNQRLRRSWPDPARGQLLFVLARITKVK